jgi:hypothetical protein
MTIAQRFSVGNTVRKGISPEGTTDGTDTHARFSRPFGTYLAPVLNPTLKRWAILTCPFGTWSRHWIQNRAEDLA